MGRAASGPLVPATTISHSIELYCAQVIVQKDGRIQLLCKGADSTVYERLGPNSAEMMELTTNNLNVCVLVAFRIFSFRVHVKRWVVSG